MAASIPAIGPDLSGASGSTGSPRRLGGTSPAPSNATCGRKGRTVATMCSSHVVFPMRS